MSARYRAAVLGGGSWGTTFSMVLSDAGTEVSLWARRPELVRAVNERHTNPDYLPGVELPAGVRATTDAAEALRGADFVVLAVPSQTLRANLLDWVPHIPAGTTVVSLMKGIELGTAKRMSEVVTDVLGVGPERVATLTGPNLAWEIAQRQPAVAVAACADQPTAERLQQACMTPYFRTYTNTDLIGCELGGAVKNVIALAVGVASGMGFGDNAKAALITRGLAETVRLAVALGADEHTMAGVAGMGDLVATCNSPLSRNRTFGEQLGRGHTLDEVISTTRQTAEGVKSSESILQLATAHGVEMPITEAVVGLLHKGLSPADAMQALMTRSAKPERYGV
ncbi:NAD(P)H-dependent glycerol-3-phosphate dehydrogenase [Allonocardiopsis opalescens]|uniref:Glycerol-3-phosphate dehydrogenase [NAD(P)+] n=1 Tax=Allonocardiopsis opalescens TaxID=1144618 RepID=A0A2T0PVT7_9ACTN|nr:NAD(P)H-dependent glycerol-3-phosphate dehydrogenase [Allonocardiopsis opalescens]PRX95654.1 glycerol 3-phosphate dehydrogenase (NAD(P)+) [Allonocardiopsis opalescens]